MPHPPLITLTSDFGVQSQGVGTMEAIAYSIAPGARVIHLMHGLPGFDIIAAARTLETVRYIPVGFHVCVCDPGVGTARKAIALLVRRGDYLIGPDNGVLIPAARVLGGVVKAHELTNPKYMNQPVSPIFHGRDIFTPAAAYLANEVPIEEFGPKVDMLTLTKAAYEEAEINDGRITAQVIQINKFGSIHLNISQETWDANGICEGESVQLEFPDNRKIRLPVCRTFGDVEPHTLLIMKDDYGRIEIAKNLGSFVGDYPVKVGDRVEVVRPEQR